MAIMCLLGMLFLFVALLDLVPFEEPQSPDYALLFSFVWNVFVIYFSYRFLLMPTKIIIQENSSFVLSGPLKTLSYLPTDMRRLDCDSDGDWYIW